MSIGSFPQPRELEVKRSSKTENINLEVAEGCILGKDSGAKVWDDVIAWHGIPNS
jgi:hypothetical protein